MADALGNLVRFILLPGQRHDSIAAERLLGDSFVETLIGDKAFDADRLRAELTRRGTGAVIPPRSNRSTFLPCDFHMYRWRHLIENLFCRLKSFRRIATRYDKTDESYAGFLHLVAAHIASR